MNNRYIVVSYDDDQQQTFFDLVQAENEGDAKSIIGELRDYAIPCDAIDLERLERMATYMAKARNTNIITRENLDKYRDLYN